MVIQNLPIIVEIDHEQDKVINIEDIEEALNYYYGAYSTVKVRAFEYTAQLKLLWRGRSEGFLLGLFVAFFVVVLAFGGR